MDRQLISSIDARLRDGVALSMAAGGVRAVPAGRKIGVFGNVAGYDGHGAAGFGITDVLHDTKNYQVQANGAVGVGFETRVLGARGGRAVFWQMAPQRASVALWSMLPQDASPA